jgi:SAM-dependent methyltransferase
MGCGFGGDFHKWRRIGVDVIGADPSELSLQEARRRFPHASLLEGDIMQIPRGLRFDVICFNFSIQYCKSYLEQLFERCHELLTPNGTVIGVVPDGDKIDVAEINPDGTLTMYIADSPYYQTYGPVTEPVITVSDMVRASKKWFSIERWGEFAGIYSTFIFRRCSG